MSAHHLRITRHDRTTLFHIDSPYWETEGYGVPFGVSAWLHRNRC